jgi:hypothetical protein
LTPGGPPLLILGVRRSGTTLLRVMLDRHSQLAVPDETYFVPQLADRHLRRVEAEDFLEDVRRVVDWDLPLDKLRARLRDGMPVGEAIGAVYAVYAEEQGKPRWGDKTPMYMQNLRLLERLFPDARYVHLIRDGRDAALSFLSMPRGIMTETWMQPRSTADFACQWRTEVAAARRLGARAGERCGASARSRAWSTNLTCRTTPATSTCRRSRTSNGFCSRRGEASVIGGPRCPPRTSPRSSMSPETCFASSATRQLRRLTRPGGRGWPGTRCARAHGALRASRYGVRFFGGGVTRRFASRCRRCSSRICGARRPCHAWTIPFSVKK